MMLTPKIISEISEEKIILTNIQMNKIHEEIKSIPKYDLSVLSERLYDGIIEKANHKLKNHQLGRTIFHLYNIERLGTYIGVEKLIYAALVVDPDMLFDILESIDKKTQEVGSLIREIL